MNKFIIFVGRILLSQIFLGAVIIKLISIINDPDGYTKYQLLLANLNLPGVFAPLFILIQILGGLALFFGYKTKVAAYVMAVFSLFLAYILGFQVEILMLYLAIAGGLFTLAANPQTPWSLDNLKKK
jgi:putative oxidoreductase